jgi:cyanophycin synthetase
VVVKPVDANHSRGVMINLTDPDQIRIAYDLAIREGSGVIVERYVPGYEHRLLVVGDRCVAASRGEPVVVDADGVRTVRQLIDQVVNADPRRGEDEDSPLSLVDFDDLLDSALRQQGLTLESIPANGKRILIQRTDNLLYDVTDQVHADVAAQVVLAAKTVGLDIAGIDLVALDISCPLEDQRAAIVEVNAGPGLLMHLKPAVGNPRPVGKAIVDSMFAPGTNARVPVVTVSGAANNGPTVRLIRHALQRIGWCTGWSTSDGFFLDDRQLGLPPAHEEPVAQRLLLHPDVEALVIESSAESILRHGLGVDRVEVAVVLGVDVPIDLMREFDLDDPERRFALHRTPVDMVLPNGAAILPSDDPACMAMQPLCPGKTILLGWNGIDDAITNQVEGGRRAVVVQNQMVRLLDGLNQKDLLPLHSISPAIPFDRLTVLGWLAGIATAWHLGMPIESLKALLLTWTGSEESHRP